MDNPTQDQQPDPTALVKADQHNLLTALTMLSGKAVELLGDDPVTLELDEVTLPKAGEILSRLRTARTELDKLRVTAKAPHLAAGRAVDDEAKGLKAGLDKLEALLVPAIVNAVDPESETNKKKGVSERMKGSLGSSMTVDFTYKFAVGRIQDVPEKYLVDADKRVKWGDLRKLILAAAKKKLIPRNIPGLKLDRSGSVKTHTKALVA